jgi:hypothetical protein
MKSRSMISQLPETGMKILNASVVLLFVGMVQGIFGQGVSANRTPTPAMSPMPTRPHRAVKKALVEPSPAPRIRSDRTASAKTKAVRPPVINYAEAMRRARRERHDRAWWRSRYTLIVFALGGYYYWDGGYWFPAFGYDPLYDTYEYDGPIYTYGDLLPDQVIVNVQRSLQQLGYYSGGLNGSLGPATRAALAAYQQDAGLAVTGSIDAPTVESLGLY